MTVLAFIFIALLIHHLYYSDFCLQAKQTSGGCTDASWENGPGRSGGGD